jgi:hypothetical protein
MRRSAVTPELAEGDGKHGEGDRQRKRQAYNAAVADEATRDRKARLILRADAQ